MTVSMLPFWIVPFVSTVTYLLFNHLGLAIRRRRFARSHGCQKLKRIHQRDPILGIDLFQGFEHAAKSSKYLEFIANWFSTVGSTFGLNVMGDDMIFTNEPKNIQAMLATQFSDFEMGQRRRDNSGKFLGVGVFNADGKDWEHGRALVRPNFVKKQVADLSIFEKHVRNLVRQLPADGSEIDIQAWLFRLTLDTGSEYLFGKSASILNPDATDTAKAFAWGFETGVHTIAKKIRMGRFGWLYRDPNYDKACILCHEYIEPIVQEAITEAKACGQAEKADVVDAEKGRGSEEERYTFLRTLAKEHRTVSATEMRNQLLNILVAARDTSACLMSSVLFELSHRQDIQSKIRRESAFLDNRPPTYEELKGLTYLNYVIKEVLRLHPPVPINVRVSNKDTTLPCGGGLDGTAPIFVEKGKSIVYSVYSTHRRPDFWGSDAEEFKPERWIDARPGYDFLPFNGGPRICPGQQFALTETAYTVTRLLQSFSIFEAAVQGEPWTESLTLTCSVGQGVNVLLKK